MYYDYDDYEGRRNNKMDGKSKHPFAITCRKCGCNDIMVIAYEHQDLGIRCRGCGYELDCGTYYTKQYDYSDM
jgi:ribosomal protein S27E